jgi:hypothetical protein
MKSVVQPAPVLAAAKVPARSRQEPQFSRLHNTESMTTDGKQAAKH